MRRAGESAKKARVEGGAADRSDFEELEQLPNVGPSIAAKLRALGVRRPVQLKGQDPYRLYHRLCAKTGVRHDPCLLDVFISAVRFMEGAPFRPWWAFTAERKKALAAAATG